MNKSESSLTDQKASASHVEDPGTAGEREGDMTFSYLLNNHKPVIGWSFFWAICAVGW